MNLPPPTGICARVVRLPPGATEKMPVVLRRSKLSTHAPYPNPSHLCKNLLCNCPLLSPYRFPHITSSFPPTSKQAAFLSPILNKSPLRPHPIWLIPHHFITLYSKMLQKADSKRWLQFLSSHSCPFSSLIQLGS